MGSVDLEVVAWHLLFKGCLWHRKNSREWINFAAKEWEDKTTGKKVFSNIVQFTDDAVSARFQKAALEAVHAIVGGP